MKLIRQILKRKYNKNDNMMKDQFSASKLLKEKIGLKCSERFYSTDYKSIFKVYYKYEMAKWRKICNLLTFGILYKLLLR